MFPKVGEGSKATTMQFAMGMIEDFVVAIVRRGRSKVGIAAR